MKTHLSPSSLNAKSPSSRSRNRYRGGSAILACTLSRSTTSKMVASSIITAVVLGATPPENPSPSSPAAGPPTPSPPRPIVGRSILLPLLLPVPLPGAPTTALRGRGDRIRCNTLLPVPASGFTGPHSTALPSYDFRVIFHTFRPLHGSIHLPLLLLISHTLNHFSEAPLRQGKG